MADDLPEPPKKGAHFAKPEKIQVADTNGLRQDVNSIGMRLRLLEEGLTNLRRIHQITEENFISKTRQYNTEFKTITSDMSEIRKEIHELKEQILIIIKELQGTAKNEDVKVLEKYISFWNPVKFATHEEIDRLVSELMGKKQ